MTESQIEFSAKVYIENWSTDYKSYKCISCGNVLDPYNGTAIFKMHIGTPSLSMYTYCSEKCMVASEL
jgi:hypothetical protein